MTLYPDPMPFISENPYGGSTIYVVWFADEDHSHVCLQVETAFDFTIEGEGVVKFRRPFPLLLTQAEFKVRGYLLQTIQESVDEVIHETYRSLYGSSVVEGLENPGDDD
jgi:hypothetical protein